MSRQQAAIRLQQLVQEAAAALGPHPELEPWPPLSGDTSCQDSSGATSSRVTVAHTCLLRGVAADTAAAIGSQISECWAERGYTVTHARGIGTGRPEILARTADGFALALQSNAAGMLALSATSPCVQP
jgi:hypothetical protein